MKNEPLHDDRSDNHSEDHSSDLTSYFPSHLDSIAIEPGQGEKKLLGVFDTDNPAKGYSIEITPASAASAVSANIAATGPATRYELILTMVNNSDQPVTIHIRQM